MGVEGWGWGGLRDAGYGFVWATYRGLVDAADGYGSLDAEYVFHEFQMVLRELRIRGNTWKMRGNT